MTRAITIRAFAQPKCGGWHVAGTFFLRYNPSLARIVHLDSKDAGMAVLEQAIDLLGRLTRGEKARLVRDIVSQLDESFPGIDSQPGVCGGEPCIVRTRIPVWLLVQTRRLGAIEADLLRAYSTLRAQDLVEAWAYWQAHPDEIERQIQANEAG
jgi:uncharacterized protein (DUF433 family)